MSCRRTGKVSLMIDGELAREEAAEMAQHLAACAVCQQAREDFLRLRQRLVSYEHAPDLAAQRQALQNILASQPSAHAVDAPPQRQKGDAARRLREQLADIFRAPQHARALLAALAFVVVSLIVLTAYLSLRHTKEGRDTTGEVAVVSQKDEARDGPRESGGNVGDAQPSPEPVKGVMPNDRNNPAQPPKTKGRAGRRVDLSSIASAGNRTRAAARNSVPEIAPAGDNENETTASVPGMDRAPAGGAPLQTARHVEQAQLLLRAFRNARPAAQGRVSDIAYEKERSKRLLYQNIVLRREAANRGNLPVEKLLSSLEPILIDIANLPVKPAEDDIRSIKERMQRQNIVSMLQVNLVPASRLN